jgi:mannose-1-phosphate guanylyltransferase
MGRNTAPAVAVAALQATATGDDPLLLVLAADHVIRDAAAFRATVAAGMGAAEAGQLVTFGIVPTAPETGYGYIEAAEPLQTGSGAPQQPVPIARFVEKPDAERAEAMLAAGKYLWNAGIFLFRARTMIEAFKAHAPEMMAPAMAAVEGAVQDLHFLRLAPEPWGKLAPISIDYAIMEKAARVLELESGFDWDDVGSWVAVAKYLPVHEGDNAANCPLTTHDASHNIVFSGGKKHVALVGVQDLIVIDTGDALLVCHRSEAENIKKLIPHIPSELQ